MRTLTALLTALLLAACLAVPASEPPRPLPLVAVRDLDGRPPALAPIVDRLELPPVRPSARPVPRVPAARPVVVRVRRSAQPERSGRMGGSVRGVASWYCGHGSACTRGHPSGLYAAAGSALRVGDWRGRTVQVAANGRLLRVVLIDFCQCRGTRLLDLYSDVWDALGIPLSRGLTTVTVSW